MSRRVSPSMNRPYGLERTCRVLEVSRSTVYAVRERRIDPRTPKRRGPKPRWSDEALLGKIEEVLKASPWHGEGHRKVWARLRHQGVRTSRGRVLRLMRENHLLAPTSSGAPHGPAAHDGTITTELPDVMWGTDGTATVTIEDGTATIFVAVDHCDAKCVGIHATKRGTRFEALEPIRQGMREHFGGYGARGSPAA